uniref:Ferrous iron transport protein A n=1 Tax=Ignisphaera aggregans TaxID=334771 RepID=A0A832FVT6_9CREN
MRLDLVKGGSRATIKEIYKHGNIVGRLYHIGILPGREVEVLINNGRGPIIIKVEDTEIVLGRGLAKKILVEVMNNE